MTGAPGSTLSGVLAEARRIGLVGPGPLGPALAQARRMADAIPVQARRLVDVGSGGGLPGLVIAEVRSSLSVALVDRRGRACDFLRRAIAALGFGARVAVVEADVMTLARDPQWRGHADAVTARGMAAPAEVAEGAIPLLRPGGVLVVTVAGAGQEWPEAGVALLGAGVVSRHDGIVVVEAGECPDRYPRARRRPALF